MARFLYPSSRGRTSSMSVVVGVFLIFVIIYAIRAIIRFY
jgi:hypothetical protein